MPRGIAHTPCEKIRRQVAKLAALGLIHDQIADVVEISDETLRKHYRAELKRRARTAP